MLEDENIGNDFRSDWLADDAIRNVDNIRDRWQDMRTDCDGFCEGCMNFNKTENKI